jgi:phosphoribulokinase
MATSEAGGIVPQELRERISKRIKAGGWGISFSSPEIADAILAEIAAAGYSVVETGRLKDVAFNYELAATCAHDAGTVRAWERDERVLKAWLGE